MRLRALPAPARRSLLLGLVTAVLLAAGCGGDDGGGAATEGGSGDDGAGESSATEWANDVCSATTAWTDSIRSTVDSLGEGELSEDELRGALDDVEGATDDFVDDLRDVGTPSTEAGEDANQSLDMLADDIEESVTTIQGAVDGASSLGEIVAAATTMSATLSTLYEQLSTTFAELEELDPGGELEAAFDDADSCDELESAQP